MPAGQVYHAPSAEAAPHPAGHLPGLIEFLARQTAGMTDSPRHAIEKGLPSELREESFRHSIAGAVVHGLQSTETVLHCSDSH